MSIRINWSKDGTKLYRGYTTSKETLSQGSMDSLDAELGVGSSVSRNDNTPYWIWNFPAPVLIDYLEYFPAGDRGDIRAEVSSDTGSSITPGITGTWTTVMNAKAVSGGVVNYWTMDTPTATQWFRLNTVNSFRDHWFDTYAIHLFGAYTTPVFEFCETNGTVITDPTFLDFANAYTNADFSEVKTFKIKNTDVVDHTYTVTLDQQQTADVPFITDRFKITSASSPTPGTSFTTPLVSSGGGFSEDIVLTATINEVDNPGSGLFYPKVTVTEAS